MSASSAEKGSSISITRGSPISDRHSDTRCCMPPESLVRQALLEAAEAGQVQQLPGPLAVPRPAPAEDLDREQDVVQHRAPGQQGGPLEQHGDVAAGLGDRRAGHGDLALGDRQQPGDHAEQGGLAAAGAAEDGDELALRDVEVDAAQRLDAARAAVEGTGHRGQLDHFLPAPFRSAITSPARVTVGRPYSTVRGGRLSVSVMQLRFRSATDTPGRWLLAFSYAVPANSPLTTVLSASPSCRHRRTHDPSG